MAGTDPKSFDRPITCLRCGDVFRVALARLPTPSPAPNRIPRRLIAVVGLALILAAGVGAYVGYSLRQGKNARPDQASDSGRRGQGRATAEPGVGDGKRYALLIGVNEYEKLGCLRYAENDASELANL